MKQSSTNERIVYAVMISLLAAALLIGTFNDEAIARTVFSLHNVPATFITTTGIYPFFASVVFFSGALFERAIHSGSGKPVRFLLCILCVLLAVPVGLIGTAALVDKDCLGGLFPSLNRNIPVIIGMSLVLVFPLFFAGYRLADGTDDRHLAKRVLCILLVFLATYITMSLLKGFFDRPRYRTVVLGYEGVGFIPWYTPFQGAESFMERFDLPGSEFRSFPSGHSMLSVSVISILLSLTWFFPSLKDKRSTLVVAGFLFAVVIMATRMVLGAHYLSDVSAGTLIGLIFVFANNLVQSRIGKE